MIDRLRTERPPETGSRPERVLVVNDSPEQLEFCAFVLRDAGYSVATAVNGRDAMAVLERETPDLVLSDVVMPQMDGIELCRHLRSAPGLSTIPLLLVSGQRKDSDSAAAGLRAGADGYLEIPFDPMRLISSVGRLLERRRAEEQVRRQLAFTQTITASLDEAVCALDDELRLTFANPAAEAALGEPGEQLLGRAIGEVLTIEDAELTGGAAGACRIRQALDGGVSERVESAMFRPRDGRVFPAAYTVSPIRTGGQIVGAVLAFHDITARAQADERLRAEQKALQEAQRVARLGSWSWLRGHERLTWSNELFRIAGRDPASGPPTCGEHAALYATHGTELQLAIERALTAGETFEIEARIARPDGEGRWIIVRGEPMRSPEGIVGLHGTAQDVTERRREHQLLQLSEQRQKHQREMLELANQRLEHSERRFRDLVENLNDVVFSLDVEGRFQYVSPAVQRYGFGAQELLTQHFGTIVHPEDLDGVRRKLEAAAAGIAEPYEFRIVDRAGATHHVRISSRAMFDHGQCAGISGVILDVTGQRRAEEQLRAAQRLEAVGRLAGGVAHDFNNLLVAINGYAEFAMEAVRPGDPMRADLEEILKAGNRAAALTRQLLAFSRKQVLKPKVINLNDVVKGMEGMLRRLIGEDIDIQTVRGADLGRVLADPGQMEQVIMNLAVNARDAMPRGGKLSIETTNATGDTCGAPGGPCVILSVTDTGCGMDEQTKAQIFEPFFTTKGPGEGTGLGLSTVHGIVNQSGGAITVDTWPGRGARFNVILPCVQASQKTVVRPVAARARRGTETILLVEDEHPVRDLAKRFLTAAGYHVLSASNGGEALLICENHKGPIDLLLTDVVMPMMGGRELWERLTQVRAGLRVVYMSGYSGTAIAHRGLLGDGVRLVEKPFGSQDLTRAVGQALEEMPGVDDTA